MKLVFASIFMMLSILGNAETAPVPAKETIVIEGVPKKGKPFFMTLNLNDTIGGINKCMTKVHKGTNYVFFHSGGGGGICIIPPGSVRVGKHNDLVRLYDDVNLQVDDVDPITITSIRRSGKGTTNVIIDAPDTVGLPISRHCESGPYAGHTSCDDPVAKDPIQ